MFANELEVGGLYTWAWMAEDEKILLRMFLIKIKSIKEGKLFYTHTGNLKEFHVLENGKLPTFHLDIKKVCRELQDNYGNRNTNHWCDIFPEKMFYLEKDEATKYWIKNYKYIEKDMPDKINLPEEKKNKKIENVSIFDL